MNSIVDNSERNIPYEYAFSSRSSSDLNKSEASSLDIFCERGFLITFWDADVDPYESISIFCWMKIDFILVVFCS